MPRRYRILVLVLLALPGPAVACSVPVFRYALERWPASPYRLTVIHRGELEPEQQAFLLKYSLLPSVANLNVEPLNLAGNLEPAKRGLAQQLVGDAPLPHLHLSYPESEEKRPPIWKGTFPSQADAKKLLDSPARQQIVRRIAAGDAVIFLLLTCGDGPADKAAQALLAAELPRIQKQIELPEATVDGPQFMSKVPLRAAFSTLTVARADAEESNLVRQLLGSEDGLEKVRGPIVFPIFGRGRALCALHGEDLTADSLQQSARFLCGACSCQVKELNPGLDLLLTADWEQLLGIHETPVEDPTRVKPPSRPAIPPGPAALRHQIKCTVGRDPVEAAARERESSDVLLLYALGAIAVVAIGLSLRSGMRRTG